MYVCMYSSYGESIIGTSPATAWLSCRGTHMHMQ